MEREGQVIGMTGDKAPSVTSAAALNPRLGQDALYEGQDGNHGWIVWVHHSLS